MYCPPAVCVVPLRFKPVSASLRTPVALPVAVCDKPLKATQYGVTEIVAVALAIVSAAGEESAGPLLLSPFVCATTWYVPAFVGAVADGP